MTETIERPLAEIYMHTASGRKYYPFAPKAEHVDINVIAHHLATRARWNGATQHRKDPERIFYSVAEHSVYVSEYLERVLNRPDLALEGLLHDGSESFNGDLIRPLKHSEEFSRPFKKVEDLSEIAIAEAFGIQWPWPKEVKIADEAVCNAEFEQIIPRHPDEDWSVGILHDQSVTAEIEIKMMLPFMACNLFLERYELVTSRAYDSHILQTMGS